MAKETDEHLFFKKRKNFVNLFVTEIKLTQKGDHSGASDNDYTGGSSSEDNGNQLNSVYQSSLQESGSTSQPRGEGVNSSTSSRILGILERTLQLVLVLIIAGAMAWEVVKRTMLLCYKNRPVWVLRINAFWKCVRLRGSAGARARIT